MENNFEVVKFIDNDFSLDVMFDKGNGTVWLNQKEISILYDLDKSRISRYIKDILSNGILNDSVVAENATTGIDGKTYNIKYYNQDIVLTIGYRIKSNRVYLFKEWFETLVNDKKAHINISQ